MVTDTLSVYFDTTVRNKRIIIQKKTGNGNDEGKRAITVILFKKKYL